MSEPIDPETWTPPANLAELDPNELGEVMNKVSEHNRIIKLSSAALKLDDAAFIEHARTLNAEAPKDVLHRTLQEAIKRLSSHADEPDLAVSTLRQVSLRNPSQWEGETVDGEEIIIRYREWTLKVFADDELVAYLDFCDSDVLESCIRDGDTTAPTAHQIEYEIVCRVLAGFILPDESKVIPVRI